MSMHNVWIYIHCEQTHTEQVNLPCINLIMELNLDQDFNTVTLGTYINQLI